MSEGEWIEKTKVFYNRNAVYIWMGVAAFILILYLNS